MNLKQNCILLRKILVVIGSLFGAYYLMNCVNKITLSTDLQRVLIVIYFFALLVIVFRIISINREKICRSRSTYAISMLIIICIMYLGRHIIIPEKYQENQISIISLYDKNEKSQGYETWISKIKLGDKNIDLSKREFNSDLWEFRDGAMYTNGERTQNVLTLSAPKGKDVAVSFEKHLWSGMVSLGTGQSTETYDLFAPISETLEVTISPWRVERTFVDTVVLLFGAIVVLYQLVLIFTLVLRCFISKDPKNNK